jgi:hypothetical protein
MMEDCSVSAPESWSCGCYRVVVRVGGVGVRVEDERRRGANKAEVLERVAKLFVSRTLIPCITCTSNSLSLDRGGYCND